jgi:hypothetical protein
LQDFQNQLRQLRMSPLGNFGDAARWNGADGQAVSPQDAGGSYLKRLLIDD